MATVGAPRGPGGQPQLLRTDSAPRSKTALFMEGWRPHAHLCLWLPDFNAVNHPKSGSTALAATRNTEVVGSSTHSLKVIRTSI